VLVSMTAPKFAMSRSIPVSEVGQRQPYFLAIARGLFGNWSRAL